MEIVRAIVMWIAGIAGFVGVLSIIPFMIIGGVILSKTNQEVDPEKKRKRKKKGIVFLVLPWVLIASGLILLFALRIVGNHDTENVPTPANFSEF